MAGATGRRPLGAGRPEWSDPITGSPPPMATPSRSPARRPPSPAASPPPVGGPAAIRAAVMGALLALAPALGRAYNVFTALALAVLLMTVLEPALLYDAGFQLTALATAGLPLLTPRIARRLVVWLRWLPFSAVIAELLAVTLAAQIATLPVLALTFHIISFVAPLANLLTVPLLAPLLVLGSLVATVGAVGGPLAGTLGLVLAWVVWPLLAFVNGAIPPFAAPPGAFARGGGIPPALAAAYSAH